MAGRSGEPGSQISRWFEGKNVFVTGATGFMGKVLLEKLLSSCSGVNRIYILVRSKNGQDIKERLLAIKDNQVFQMLRESHPDRLDKLVALRGDILEADLGLSPADLEILKDVHIVFNMAATIHFNQDLRTSLTMNVLATRSCLELCLKIKGLLVFVHVSTAYANCDIIDIEERVYPLSIDIEELIKLCESCSDDELQHLTKRILGKRPNTYTLTKALAENVVESYKSKLPVAIARPSIVTAAASTPIPGWVENNNGPTGIIAAYVTGLLKIQYCADDLVIDFVPVDYANNALLVIAWAIANKLISSGKAPGNVSVYNITSGNQNPLKQSDLVIMAVHCTKRYTFENFLWSQGVRLTSSRILYCVGYFWLHTIPAHIYDTITRTSGKGSLVSVQTKLRKVMKSHDPFMLTTFRFSDDNFRHLLTHMTEQDREVFPIDVKKIVWQQYIETYVLGIRKYLLGHRDGGLSVAILESKRSSFKRHAWKIFGSILFIGLSSILAFKTMVDYFFNFCN